MQAQQWPEYRPAVVSVAPVFAEAKSASKETDMTGDRVDRTVVTEGPTAAEGQEPVQTAAGQEPVRTVSAQEPMQTVAAKETVRTDSRRITSTSPGGSEMTRRVILFVFGLIQIVIGLRIVLLLLDARTGNALVSGILDVSKIFVGPFEGILKTNALSSGGSTLDVAAVVAFVGWTVLELIVIWAVGIFRREPA